MGASRLKPLTTKEVESLTKIRPAAIKHLSLGGVPGFVMVHTPSGYMSYALVYRANGERKKLTLGSAKSLSLAEARKHAGQFRAQIEAGADPHSDKLEQRQRAKAIQREATEQRQLDVEVLWEKYMLHVASRLRSQDEKDRIFRRYILPVVSGLCVNKIVRGHALEIIDDLVAREKRRMADKVRQEGAAFFQWLLEREHVDRNVFAGVRKACAGKAIRTRVLSDPEVRAIWTASKHEGRWGIWIKLLILSGARNMEVRGAKWSEFDLQSHLWTIPAERSKNGRAHTVHLTDGMLALLDRIPRFKDVDLLFPAIGNPDRPMSGDQKVKDRIDQRMRATLKAEGADEPERWCVHDFRRTIATGLQRLGFRPDIADQVIGHVGSTRWGAGAHYLHHAYETERREALMTWTAHITQVCCVRERRKRVTPSKTRVRQARVAARRSAA
jgi:integrase